MARVPKYSKIFKYVLSCSIKCRSQYDGHIGLLSISTYILFNHSSEIIDNIFYWHTTAIAVGLLTLVSDFCRLALSFNSVYFDSCSAFNCKKNNIIQNYPLGLADSKMFKFFFLNIRYKMGMNKILFRRQFRCMSSQTKKKLSTTLLFCINNKYTMS